MAEEHRCQAPRLCANNCGFFGSPATQDFCSKCYRDLQLKEQGKLALNQTLSTSSSSSIASPSSVSVSVGRHAAAEEEAVEEAMKKKDSSVGVGVEGGTQANRCSQCRKRVGLTGFKCRCGMVFCGCHRYPEQHGCGFDFKSLGKEQIARANPVVKGEKLQKI